MELTHCDWCGTVEKPKVEIKTVKGFHREVGTFDYKYPRAFDLCPVCLGALKALITVARERGIAQGDLAPPKPKPNKSWMKKIWG